MGNYAIRVENLGKQYTIGQYQGRYKSLRETLVKTFTAPFQRLVSPNGAGDQTESTIWALKDVSFEVQHGEVIGIIGRNGAGKSTLLKILARITEPTEGEVRLKGRVGSLLEVGTGFHPELTGRENIFLNGAILGMSRQEIQRKFDEIVDFAEIEKFIDTPAKHYSSGMYMRLAFAVAAHLEPEILLVDEVLAVGDLHFQKKCLGKMGEVSEEGRTVLFVSHNMTAIKTLCRRGVLLEKGRLMIEGMMGDVIDEYTHILTCVGSEISLGDAINQIPPDPIFQLIEVELSQEGQMVTDRVLNGEPLQIKIHYRVHARSTGLRVFFDLCDNEDAILFRSFHDESSETIPVMLPGEYISQTVIPEDILAPAHYILHIYATIFNLRMCIPFPGIQISLFVEATGRYNRAYISDTNRGKLAIHLPWKTYEV